jgi:hypothetical protein
MTNNKNKLKAIFNKIKDYIHELVSIITNSQIDFVQILIIEFEINWHFQFRLLNQ